MTTNALFLCGHTSIRNICISPPLLYAPLSRHKPTMLGLLSGNGMRTKNIASWQIAPSRANHTTRQSSRSISCQTQQATHPTPPPLPPPIPSLPSRQFFQFSHLSSHDPATRRRLNRTRNGRNFFEQAQSLALSMPPPAARLFSPGLRNTLANAQQVSRSSAMES